MSWGRHLWGHFRGCLPEHVLAYYLDIWVSYTLLQTVVIASLFSKGVRGSFLASNKIQNWPKWFWLSRVIFCWALTFAVGPSPFLLFEMFRQRLVGHLRACGQLSSDWPPGHLNAANKIAWGACQGDSCCCCRNTFCSLAFVGNCSPGEKLFTWQERWMVPDCQVYRWFRTSSVT